MRALHKGNVRQRLEKIYSTLSETINRLDIAQPDLKIKLEKLKQQVLDILSEPPL